MDNECCAKCKYYHRLKNNFKVGEGFEESHCCDVLLHLPKDESEGWVQEVTPQNRCEMYKEKDHVADADKMIEPTTKNNLVDGKDNNATSTDCISRQEAIDTIRQLYIDLATQKYVIDLLKVLPSVTPQTRQGHWIPVFQGDEIIDYRCSCCEFGNTFGKGTVGMNYCPRCGSRNEVEE